MTNDELLGLGLFNGGLSLPFFPHHFAAFMLGFQPFALIVEQIVSGLKRGESFR